MYQKKCVHQAVMRLGKYVPQGLPTHVNKLRDKIEDDPSAPRHIQTVWGVGYRFCM